MTFILFPEDAPNFADQLGGKASALAALTLHDFPIPAWFVLTPAACVGATHAATLVACHSAPTHPHTLSPQSGSPLSPPVQAALTHALAQLCPQGDRPNTNHQQTQPHPAASPAISPQQQRTYHLTDRPSLPPRANHHNSRPLRTAKFRRQNTRNSTLQTPPHTPPTSSRRTAAPTALPVRFQTSRSPPATLPSPPPANSPPRQYRTPTP